MTRLDAGVQLAQGLTGAAPAMAGELVIETCPACTPCRLQWRVAQGSATLTDGTRVLLQSRPGTSAQHAVRS
ncbi:MAG: hypothetical protein JJU21_11615 [Salinarimonas sp.]|nr:hypothetical protein [Salinarimonas sp.]